jgi:riboflavin kinase/FMN adenylyltransferase
MKVVYFPDAPRPKWPAPVLALGNFDGLHRGHARLVEQVRRRAGERGGTPVAMVFDPHPPKVLRPDKAPPLLMTLDQKREAFERAGIEALVVVRFTRDLSRWEPELFVETVLLDWLRAVEVWVGDNFLFGRDRTGTFTLLKALGEDREFRVDKIDPVLYKDFVVSSTRIRHLVTEGRVDEAGALLGHHYFIDGTVVRGDGRGHELGYPTANLETAAGLRHLRQPDHHRRPGPPVGVERRHPAHDRRRPADGRDPPARRRAGVVRPDAPPGLREVPPRGAEVRRPVRPDRADCR